MSILELSLVISNVYPFKSNVKSLTTRMAIPDEAGIAISAPNFTSVMLVSVILSLWPLTASLSSSYVVTVTRRPVAKPKSI